MNLPNAQRAEVLVEALPYIRKYFEMSDLACLIAPRTLVIAAGEKDRIFPIDGTKRNFEEIKTDKCCFLCCHFSFIIFLDIRPVWRRCR